MASLTLEQLEREVPGLLDYTGTMPDEIRRHARIKVHPPGGLIHQKDCELQYFGIVAKGENRVINEFDNGKVYMIETNTAIDFIGEVTLLAGMERTSVTIEAVSACTVIYISRKEAERWFNSDQHILRKMAERTAFKLYRSSYNNGLKLYYPPAFLLADHLVRAYEHTYPSAAQTEELPALRSHTVSDSISLTPGSFTLSKTRERLGEELGMNIKTLDRTIRTMQQQEYFSLVKGKITFGYEEYIRLKTYISTTKG